ncbi:MAG TPA: phage holin family protein [Candidatus Limivivens intestinipullorum]|uniref:Phage holin family protein n=1 Tax=Candidatus Limivivens intestinipullorum TaxID=2840858 RepID=A0A9D1ET05_9FIRM|nr:phage holin family protein [Candidatus Limivivens intestinipullorum]
MDQIINYIKPELVVVAIVLYIIGMGLKKSTLLLDKYIPIVLGALGIILCAVWVFATSAVSTPQDIAMAAFTAIVQGILVAGASTYINQIVKQSKKVE